MLIAICCCLWYAVGFVPLLIAVARISDEITLSDLMLSLLGGLGGPISAAIAIIQIGDKVVLWRRKC